MEVREEQEEHLTDLLVAQAADQKERVLLEQEQMVKVLVEV